MSRFYPDTFDSEFDRIDRLAHMATLLNSWSDQGIEGGDRASSGFYCAALDVLNRYTGDTKESEQALTAIMDGAKSGEWLIFWGYATEADKGRPWRDR
jgi:hypothetical protein